MSSITLQWERKQDLLYCRLASKGRIKACHVTTHFRLAEGKRSQTSKEKLKLHRVFRMFISSEYIISCAKNTICFRAYIIAIDIVVST